MDDKEKKLLEEAVAPLQGAPKEETILGPANLPTPEPLKEETETVIAKEVIPSDDGSSGTATLTVTTSETDLPKEPVNEANATTDLEPPYGVPTTTELNKINRLAKRKLAKEEVFVYPVKFVGDGMIENRFIKLHKSLLEVFRKDANRGVSFLLDHSWTSFGRLAHPYGRSFEAKVTESLKEEDAPKDELWGLYGAIYMVRGKAKDGVSTDSLIKDIEDGTLSDVSIGFGMDRYECSICGSDIWECNHWPGKEYEVDGEMKLCYIIGKPPGFLMELSGVFDGAYASAKILARDGEEEQEFYEVKNLKELAKDTPMFHILSKRGLFTFAKKEKSPVVVPVIDEARAKEIAGANWQENLFKLASEGKTLRIDLIEDALRYGVKAQYPNFPEDDMRAVLETSDIDRIKSFREKWIAQARDVIPTSRKIKSEPGSASTVPAIAYKIRKESDV